MISLSASEVRKEFAETLNRVAYKSERIALDRRGKPVAALVPIEDVELLERLEEELDLAEALAALSQTDGKGAISHEELKAKLGL